jgi:hypothetical protein
MSIGAKENRRGFSWQIGAHNGALIIFDVIVVIPPARMVSDCNSEHPEGTAPKARTRDVHARLSGFLRSTEENQPPVGADLSP